MSVRRRFEQGQRTSRNLYDEQNQIGTPESELVFPKISAFAYLESSMGLTTSNFILHDPETIESPEIFAYQQYRHLSSDRSPTAQYTD